MHFGYHGGKCCGMKVIYGFGCPTEHVDKLDACNHPNSSDWAPTGHRPDINGHHVSSNTRFFIEAAPQETNKERLDRYLKYAKKHQPQGIIEVVLTQCQCVKWKNLLFRRGFRIVNKNKNSNSGNTCFVFHKNMN